MRISFLPQKKYWPVRARLGHQALRGSDNGNQLIMNKKTLSSYYEHPLFFAVN